MKDLSVLDILFIAFLLGIIILILAIYDNSLTQKIIDLNNNLNRVHIYNDCLQHGGSYYCLEE